MNRWENGISPRIISRGLLSRSAYCPLSLLTIACRRKKFTNRHKTAEFAKVSRSTLYLSMIIVLELLGGCCYHIFSSADEDSPSDEVKGLQANVRDQLLQGLADDAETIRYYDCNARFILKHAYLYISGSSCHNHYVHFK